MISGTIADWQITASSTYPTSWVKGCQEKNGRLFRQNGLAWCAKFKSSSEWLQIDLGVQALVSRNLNIFDLLFPYYLFYVILFLKD